VSYEATDGTLRFDPTYLSGTGNGKLPPAENAPWAALSVEDGEHGCIQTSKWLYILYFHILNITWS
jgi:hypothetical protein